MRILAFDSNFLSQTVITSDFDHFANVLLINRVRLDQTSYAHSTPTCNHVSKTMDHLELRIREHSSLFSSMVELIPAKYYVFNEDDFLQSSKYFHKKKRPQMSEQDAKEARIKAKKARLDPTARKKVEEINKEAKDDTNNQEMSEEDHDNDTHSNREPLKLNLERIESVPLSELRERLKNKIREHRLKRKAPLQDENADIQNGETISKKMKREQFKQKKIKKKKGRSVAQTNPLNLHKMEDETIDNDTVQFNKFDFGTSSKSDKTRKQNLKKLLSKAEEQQQKIAKIVEQDPSKGKEINEKIKWQQALDKAQGIPRKDDPLLLQKTLKKKEKHKKVSQKQWQERLEHQKQRKEKQQEKRRKHIQERIDVKKLKSKMSTKKKNRRKKVVVKS